MFMKEQFKGDFMNPQSLKKAIDGVYISKMFADELRVIFTELERRQYIARQNKYKCVQHCVDSQSAICFKRLARVPFSMQDNTVSVFRTQSVLSGVKFDHFVKPLKGINNDSKSSESYSAPSDSLDSSQEEDTPTPRKVSKDYLKIDTFKDLADQSPIHKHPVIITTTIQNPYDSEEVLMERQRHQCVFSKNENRKQRLNNYRNMLLEYMAQAEQEYFSLIGGEAHPPRKSHHHRGFTYALNNAATDVVGLPAEQFSFDEDDRTITDMLDSLDRTKSVLNSPPAGSKTQSGKKSGSNRKSDFANSTTSNKTELEELELLALHEARSRKPTQGLRQIEHEMHHFQPPEPAGGRIFSQNNSIDGEEDDQDNFHTLANKEDVNKLNILHRLSQKLPSFEANDHPSF